MTSFTPAAADPKLAAEFAKKSSVADFKFTPAAPNGPVRRRSASPFARGAPTSPRAGPPTSPRRPPAPRDALDDVELVLARPRQKGPVFQLVPQRFAKEIGVMTGLVGMAGGVGGFYLASIHARKAIAPRPVVFVHAGAAVIGFLLLAGGAFNLI